MLERIDAVEVGAEAEADPTLISVVVFVLALVGEDCAEGGATGVMVGKGMLVLVPLTGVIPPFAPVAEIKDTAFA